MPFFVTTTHFIKQEILNVFGSCINKKTKDKKYLTWFSLILSTIKFFVTNYKLEKKLKQMFFYSIAGLELKNVIVLNNLKL